MWFECDALAGEVGKAIVDCSSSAFLLAIGLARGLMMVAGPF
jgi:hypothetical protein